MFKLLPLLLACIVCSIASPDPDGLYNIISGRSILKPYQTISLTAKTKNQQQLQSNAVTSGEQEDNNDTTSITDDRESGAPASVTSIATPAPISNSQVAAPASIARLTAVASAGSALASASASRSSLRVSSSINVPSGSSSSTTIQHHILPPETIPLPITISTRPGLRTVIAPETITIREPTVAKVGEVVQKIPTAVSHQSQTVVHKHARVVTPIVAPAVRTIKSQVLRAYHTPIIFSPQTSVVRRGNTNANANANASANAKTSARASASASIISNASNAQSSANNKYKL